MIRIYSANGWDVLKPYLRGLGGSVDCLAADANGGVLAALPSADHRSIPLLKSIAGVHIIPIDKSVTVPAAAATLFGAIYGITTTDTVRDALDKIYKVSQVEDWNPNHAI